MAEDTYGYRTNLQGKREPILVSVKEAAQLLNLSRSYLYRETKTGNIPHVKIGSRTLFQIIDLNTWIEGQKIDMQESRCA